MDGTKINSKLLLLLICGGIIISYFPLLSQSNEVKSFRNLGDKINSKYDEFLPNVYKDTLYYRKNLNKKKISIFKVEINKYLCSDPYIKTFAPNPIPIKEYSESSKPVDKDYKLDPSEPTFFNYTDSIQRWELPKRMMYNISSEYNDLHPAFAPDGSFMVFASDRPAAAGGDRMNNTDLFISFRRKDGTWSEPKSLGKKINTTQNEISPYIGKDFTLYFASKGYRSGSAEIAFSGQGDNLSDIQLMESKYNYDIIMVKASFVAGKVKYSETPVKLPYPINTEWDEIGPTLYHDSLIISSNRISSPVWGIAFGGFDLYGWCYDKCPCDSQCNPVIITGKIKGTAFKKLPEAVIKFYGVNKDNQKVFLKDVIVGNEGKYSVELAWHCSYFAELIHKCSDAGIIKDSICPKNPCRTDSIQKLRMDFEVNGSCPDRIAENCPDCPVRCNPYYIDIEIVCDKDTLNFIGDLILMQNNFEKQRIKIFKPGIYTIKLTQEDKRSDDIVIKYESECLKPQNSIEKKYEHPCNADSVDRYKLVMELPEKCCANSCKFTLSGKIKCADGSNIISGKVNIISIKDGGVYIAEPNSNGEYQANITQLNNTGIYKIYFGEGDCRKEYKLIHKCSDGDVKNYNITIPENCCKECNSLINIEGIVSPDRYNCSLAGKISVIDLDKKLRYETKTDDYGKFSIKVDFSKSYRVIYENYCSQEKLRKSIKLEKCPDQELKISLLFEVKGTPDLLDISSFNVPFFVTGYWKPNTKRNLYDLFEKFNNPNFGKGNSCCISDPASDFDENYNKINYLDYTDSVTQIIKQAKDFIVNKLKAIDCGCDNKPEKIRILFTGYADGRDIECNCKYLETEIKKYGINIDKGDAVNNFTLSELRAFYTAEEVINFIQNSDIYRKYADLIEVIAIGAGVNDNSDKSDKIKRSVEIKFETVFGDFGRR